MHFKEKLHFAFAALHRGGGLWVKRANRALCFAESTLHENKVR